MKLTHWVTMIVMCNRSIPLLLLLTLFGCATQPIHKTTPPPTWSSKIKRLGQIHNWHITAQLGVKTEKGAGAFTLDWQQNRQHYKMVCLGPFGQILAELSGTPLLASLITNTGEHKTGESTLLLKQVLGVSIPTQELLFWVRGIPDPTSTSQLFFNEKAEIAEIEQSGWKITYGAWTSTTLPLPQKITLEKQSIRVKMVISNWEYHST